MIPSNVLKTRYLLPCDSMIVSCCRNKYLSVVVPSLIRFFWRIEVLTSSFCAIGRLLLSRIRSFWAYSPNSRIWTLRSPPYVDLIKKTSSVVAFCRSVSILGLSAQRSSLKHCSCWENFQISMILRVTCSSLSMSARAITDKSSLGFCIIWMYFLSTLPSRRASSC